MKAFVIHLLVFALTFAGAGPGLAQLDPCEPDFPETPFGPLQNHTITLPGNCQIQVTYATRLAGGTFQDLYIEFIQTVPTPPSPACQMYWNMSAKDLLWIVTQEMADDNPMGFTKPAPGCAVDWRVIKGACWFRAFDLSNGRYSSSYCEESVCCLEAYEVCFDDCGAVTSFDPQSIYPPGGVCQAGQTEPGACEPTCGNPSWDL